MLHKQAVSKFYHPIPRMSSFRAIYVSKSQGHIFLCRDFLVYVDRFRSQIFPGIMTLSPSSLFFCIYFQIYKTESTIGGCNASDFSAVYYKLGFPTHFKKSFKAANILKFQKQYFPILGFFPFKLYNVYISRYQTESIIELYKASGDTYGRLSVFSFSSKKKKRKTSYYYNQNNNEAEH